MRDSEFLSRDWKAGDASLSLRIGGEFTASRLGARYFKCQEGTPTVYSGSGAWESRESEGTTAVFLRFDSGCSATFWLGQSNGDPVLWTNYEVDGVLQLLK
ncbi:hypothetical protein GCM10017752_48060 [Streptomyces roseoviridis]